MILYNLLGHINKMRIIIRYFFLKISIQTCLNLTNTRLKIDINLAHFFFYLKTSRVILKDVNLFQTIN